MVGARSSRTGITPCLAIDCCAALSVAHCTNVQAASGFFVLLPTEISSPPANELNPPVLPGMGNTPQSNVFELSSCGMKNEPAGVIPTFPPWNAVSELDVVSVLA